MKQIAFAWSEECAKELEAMGFKKTEVYVKNISTTGTQEEVEEIATREFWRMKHPPYQFVSTSFWGVANE